MAVALPPPEIPEPIGHQLSVAHRVLNVAVARATPPAPACTISEIFVKEELVEVGRSIDATSFVCDGHTLHALT